MASSVRIHTEVEVSASIPESERKNEAIRLGVRDLRIQAERLGLALVDVKDGLVGLESQETTYLVRGVAAPAACGICGDPLSTRSHELRDGRWAHGPCKGFDEERHDAGFPDAPDRAALRKRIRFEDERNIQ
jgi:hypothetical protein